MNHPEFSIVPAGTAPTRSQETLPEVVSNSANGSFFADVENATPTLRLVLNQFFAIACGFVAVVAWESGYWPCSIACWLAGGHFMHTFALSLHDAAHGCLHPNRKINEFLGHLYGTLILVPLTVYRRAHVLHHAQLSSVDDPELYPFVVPGTSRLFRITCAISEIVFGYVHTPLLFVRSTWIDKKLTAPLRRQIQREYLLVISMVVVTLMTTWIMGTWNIYLVGILAPALVAGSYQTLRKYSEHMGLSGPTVLHLTRSIVPQDPLNRTVSSLLQHVGHHGAHHVHARIPFFKLPPASEEVYRDRWKTLPVYNSYAAAFLAMLPSLRDPKAGAQWEAERKFMLSCEAPLQGSMPENAHQGIPSGCNAA